MLRRLSTSRSLHLALRRKCVSKEDRLKTVYLEQMQSIQEEQGQQDSPLVDNTLLYEYTFQFERLDRQLSFIQLNCFLFGVSTCVTLSMAPVYCFLPALGSFYCL